MFTKHEIKSIIEEILSYWLSCDQDISIAFSKINTVTFYTVPFSL